MNINELNNHLHEGYPMKRESWKNDSFIYLQSKRRTPIENIHTMELSRPVQELFISRFLKTANDFYMKNMVFTDYQIFHVSSDNTITPYFLSPDDIATNDWQIYE